MVASVLSESNSSSSEDLEDIGVSDQPKEDNNDLNWMQNIIQGDMPVAGAPTFALTLAQANAGNILDYTSQTDVKIYNKAPSELPYKFDCRSKNVPMFCEKLKDRVQESGWEAAGGNIMSIPDSEGVNQNLITEYS